MKFILVLAAVVTLAVPAISMQERQGAADPASPSGEELKAMPELKLQDFDGKKVASDELKGSVLVLDFWATWCGPCISEVPMLNKLQEKYAGKGLKVIGVTMASGEAKDVKPLVGRVKMKYTVLMGDDDQAYDLNIMGFPTTYLVTKDLKIFRKYVGAGPRKAAQIEADVEKLLEDKKQ
ncbi:MAG TPA: TlpA disulfide reductase family protein [Blastocatellia bacterium]|jgi:thiol-disulfide isomerase/thioredoxin|nr:TlpA disulfide reductase family protein [Blastocatellia bacterium]